MSYVIANTSNPLGRRGLGFFDRAPYPYYPQPRSLTRLNGVNDEASGAVTYRIDPRTGSYIFSRTDIKPRGPFLQNTFQHPAPPVLSALGTRVLPIGKSVSRSTLRGLGCPSCSMSNLSGGLFRRSRLRGLGVDATGSPSADVFIDPNTGCQVDSDGVLLTCPTGPGGKQQPTQPSDPALLQQLIASGTQIAAAAAAPRMVVQPTPQAPSWWDQKTNVGGMLVSNPVLAAGAVGFAFLLAGAGKGRR
jgi:hypothetical protein